MHVYTSPHLVRFNERIRVASGLVSDAALTDALEHVERVNDGAAITVFEVITAVAFHLFAQTPADLCVLEVGLGGRGDATNVVARPAACAITSISLDHREMLGDTLQLIAGEKAGIMKPDVPVAIGAQPDVVTAVLLDAAARVGAPVLLRGRDWTVAPTATGFRYDGPQRQRCCCRRHPCPALHQLDNAGIAIAALLASGLADGDAAIAAGIVAAEWPARLQRLRGRLAQTLPPGWELWLDGGHNPGAGEVLGAHLATWADRPVHLIVGMKDSKDAAGFLRPLLPYAATLWAVAEPGQHSALPVEAIVAASGGVARPGPHVADALAAIARRARAGPGADLWHALSGRRGVEAGMIRHRHAAARVTTGALITVCVAAKLATTARAASSSGPVTISGAQPNASHMRAVKSG